MAFIALIGLYLNLRGKWEGYLLWLFSNAYWCAYNCFNGDYVQSLLFAVFWILSLFGLCLWRKKTAEEARQAKEHEEIRSRTLFLCLDLINTEKRLARSPGRIKISDIIRDAHDILKLLRADCNKAEKTKQ